ncbi:MAG: thioredoxin [Candidatus Aenigmarchaeota archaeon]|nr:thioredoxin [Candidatus Aenigmarchaeota archaeon]
MTQIYFDDEVIKSDVPTVVDFYADWCGPCKSMEPALEKLAEEYDGKIKFTKINVDFEQGLAMAYDVQGIPNLTVFKGGKPVKQIVGARGKDDLKKEIDNAVGKAYTIDLSEKIELKDDFHANKDCGCQKPKEDECGGDDCDKGEDCCKKGGKGCGDC